MNFKEILELIDKVADRGIGAVEIEQAGSRVRIEGTPSSTVIHSGAPGPQVGATSAPPAPAPQASPAGGVPAPAPEEDSEAGLHVITSPIVGTFYRAPNPESENFANVGDRVTKGKVLCIIEAMKLMNEIEADAEGVVVRIYPQNGQPVEYGEKLFAIRT